MSLRRGSFTLLLLSVTLAHADCVVQSAPTPTHLVELYTSEGCSSCPPADRWLSRLDTGPGLIALAFHVDYWDDLGWRDRFADPRFAARQRALLGANGSGIVYTPEVALDGREWPGWSQGIGSVSAAPARATPPGLLLHVGSGNPLHLQLDVTPSATAPEQHWRAFFAVTEDALESAVRAGENGGRTLHHDHVVRAFSAPLLLSPSARADLALPADLRIEHAAVIAFVQNIDSGVVVQAVQQSLSSCIAP